MPKRKPATKNPSKVVPTAKKNAPLAKSVAKSPQTPSAPSVPQASNRKRAVSEPITITLPVGLNRALKRWCSNHEATTPEAVVHAVREMLAAKDAEDDDTEVPKRGNSFLHGLLS
jgi:hypothetical protein